MLINANLLGPSLCWIRILLFSILFLIPNINLVAQEEDFSEIDYFQIENEILDLESLPSYDVEVDDIDLFEKQVTPENSEYESGTTIYRNWQLSLGSFYATFKKVQTTASGDEEIPKPWTYLSTGIEVGSWKNFSLVPSLGFAFPKSGDDDSSRLIYFLRGDIVYRYARLGLRLGTSMIFNRYSFSESGPAELRNGTSKSSFFRSGEAKTSIQNTLDLGLEFEIVRWASIAGRYVGYSLFDSEKKDSGLMVELLFFLDKKDEK